MWLKLPQNHLVLHQVFHPELEDAVVSTLDNESWLLSELGGSPYTQFNPHLLLDSKSVFPSHTRSSSWLWLNMGGGHLMHLYFQVHRRNFPCAPESDPRPHLESGLPYPNFILIRLACARAVLHEFSAQGHYCIKGPKISRRSVFKDIIHARR